MGHLADGAGELISLADAVLQQVGVPGRAFREQGDGVLGVVVLRQDHDPGAGVAFADLLGPLDALPLEVGWHPDVGDDDVRVRRLRTLYELGVIRSHPDDLQVVFDVQQRTDPLADDDVVVGEEDRDRRHDQPANSRVPDTPSLCSGGTRALILRPSPGVWCRVSVQPVPHGLARPAVSPVAT